MMTDNDLMTPRVKGWGTWKMLAGLSLYLTFGIWQVFQERFLPRDSVELSSFDISIASNCIYSGGVAFISLCFAKVQLFIKKYGLKNSFLYLSFVSALSYFLVVYLLDWTTLEAGRMLQDSLVRRLESSVVEIEEMRGPIKQRYQIGVVPYSIEEHTKYAGEDVVFECHRMVSFHTLFDVSPVRDQVVWEKNGKKVHPSDHINITWTFERITNGVSNNDEHKHYLISSKLTLLFIDTADFGNYSCMVKTWAQVTMEVPLPKPKPPMCPLEPPPPCMCMCLCPPPQPPKPRLELPMDKTRWKDKYDTVKVFNLVQMQELTRQVHAPPGGLVSFSATYDHMGDIEDVSFDYTIGSDSFDSVCGWSIGVCSFSVQFYWIFFRRGGDDSIFTTSMGRVRMQTAVTGTGWQCVCTKAYNYHEFWFYRRFFNLTSRREEIRSVKYPHRVILAPRTPDLFFYNFTNKIDPLAKEPCWVRPQKQLLVDYCKQDEAMVDWTLWFFLQLEAWAICITGLTFAILLYCVLKLLMKLVIPVRNRILEGSFFPCEGCLKTITPLGCIHDDENAVETHDVFISNADDELIRSYQLTEILEGFGLSVYLPDRNILGGQLKTEAISAAIASSKLFIVMLTKEYINGGMQNRFEFQLILKKALKNITDYKKLLILKGNHVYVPCPLNKFCMLDWTTNDNLDVKCRMLKNWSNGKVNSGQICVC